MITHYRQHVVKRNYIDPESADEWNLLRIYGEYLAGNYHNVYPFIKTVTLDSPLYYDRTMQILVAHVKCAILGAKNATMTWMLIAKRFGICRDIARKIGYLIWEGRERYYHSAKFNPPTTASKGAIFEN